MILDDLYQQGFLHKDPALNSISLTEKGISTINEYQNNLLKAVPDDLPPYIFLKE